MSKNFFLVGLIIMVISFIAAIVSGDVWLSIAYLVAGCVLWNEWVDYV